MRGLVQRETGGHGVGTGVRCLSAAGGDDGKKEKQEEPARPSGFFESLRSEFQSAIENDAELKRSMEELRGTKVGARSVEDVAKDTAEELKGAAGSAKAKAQQARDSAEGAWASWLHKDAEGESKGAASDEDPSREASGGEGEGGGKGGSGLFSGLFSRAAQAEAERREEATASGDSSAGSNEQGGGREEGGATAASDGTTGHHSGSSSASDDDDAAAGASAGAGAAAAQQKSSYFRDVVMGVFGRKPARASASGDGEYPWVQYKDVSNGKIMYRNTKTGRVQEVKPPDFEALATDAAYVEANTEATAIAVVGAGDKTRWDRMSDALMNTPLLQSIMSAGDAVRNSEMAARFQDRVEDARETWETSQNPIIYNASYAVDRMFAETEWASAVREVQMIDDGFDLPEFLTEMRDEVIPVVVRSFLQGDRSKLNSWFTEGGMAQINAVLRAREAEGWKLNDSILSVNNVDLTAAKLTQDGTPIMVVSGMVQQINCMWDKDGKIVEGKEDEIRATYYIFAMQRAYDEQTTQLVWKVSEMSMLGSVLYL
jgi:import inner membrane translocase subunit TIM44